MSVRQEPHGSNGNQQDPTNWQKVIIFTICAAALVAVVWVTGSAEAATVVAAALLSLLVFLSGRPPAEP